MAVFFERGQVTKLLKKDHSRVILSFPEDNCPLCLANPHDTLSPRVFEKPTEAN